VPLSLWGLVLSACLLACGCLEEEASKRQAKATSSDKEAVKIVYVDWASELASSHVVKAVIEQRLHRSCELLSVTLVAMWEAIASGDQDGMVAAWLPSLQGSYLKEFRSRVDNLGPNLEGTRIGLVVPEYVDIGSIKQLKGHAGAFDRKIIGIDPHAGLMEKTAAATEAYRLDSFQLVSGSGPTMTTTLGKAIAEKRWIVVTGWTPHWKFAKWDLKYLADPKNIYGDEEHISTIVRKGLKADMPEVYRFLDAFHWRPRHMEEVMLLAQDKETGYLEAARRWVSDNEALVSSWVDG
jgi:glycine betaine/proline transport system substrate-binding protein